ncbi:MAG: glycosyltransferase, partial [Methanomassiliicoccales archaeon]|nr:glycosyltransferase [Methanomassiliicoccales archaeon]
RDVYHNLLDFFPRLHKHTERFAIIPHGIEVDRFADATPRDIRSELNFTPDTFLLGFFGRFMSQKGFRYLVEAIGILVRESPLPRPLVVLTFSNDGFYREEQERVRNLGLNQYFRFLSFESNIGSTLAGVDAVVLPSLWEASSLLSMEAMVSGVPIIGTNCIGLREVLTDTPSRICPPRDSQALAKEILAELVSSSKPKALSFKHDAARRFDVRDRATEVEALLRSTALKRRWTKGPRRISP